MKNKTDIKGTTSGRLGAGELVVNRSDTDQNLPRVGPNRKFIHGEFDALDNQPDGEGDSE